MIDQPLPFSLHTGCGEIICHTMLRNLPGKRQVFQGTLEGKPVIAKCFGGCKARRDYRREVKGMRGLLASRVNTAALLFHGKGTFGKEKRACVRVVVTEFIEQAVSFEELWKQALTENQRLVWLYRIVRLLGKLYCFGITPVDIHLDNLLVRDQDVYLIDGGGVSVRRGLPGFSRSLSRKRAIDNFTLFMSVLAPRHEIFLQKIYLALANYAPAYSGVDVNTLIFRIHQWRKWRERYLEKTVRTCSDFIAKKCRGHFQVITRDRDSPALRSLLTSLLHEGPEGECIKTGRTNTVVKTELEGGVRVVIKRYRSTKRFSLLRMLKTSRARRSWQGAWLLKMLDIDTPEPLAMLERKRGPFITESYLVTEYIPGTELAGYFNTSSWPKDWKQVVHQVKDCLSSLERSLVHHGDMKATNFIVYKSRVFIIDLDSLLSCKTERQFRPLWKKDCDRFMKNWQNSPDIAELFVSGH